MNFRLLWILMVGLFAYLLFWEWSQESAAKAELVATTRVDEVSSGVDSVDSSNASKISNGSLTLVVDNLSGSIIGVELSEYPVLQKEGSPNVRLLGSEGAFKFYVKSGFGIESPVFSLKNNDGSSITLVSDDGLYKKVISIKEGYLVDINDSYLGGNKPGDPFVAMYRTDGKPLDATDSWIDNASYVGVAFNTPDDPYDSYRLRSIDERLLFDQVGGWVGFIQKYFLTALLVNPNDVVTMFANPPSVPGGVYSMGSIVREKTVSEINSGVSHKLFFGPKIRSDLMLIAKDLELSIDMGWFWFLAQPLVMLLVVINDLINNWGVSILLLTVVVKLLLWPISAAGFRSMAKMRVVQPKLQEIQQRYKDDRQKLGVEMMALYKKEKINPAGGCFPMLLQFPVFIALFFALREIVELRHAPFFFWLQDLSAPDPYFVLPVVMGGLMYLTQQLNPTPPNMDPMQIQVMKYMPVVFSVFFIFLPSGLVLYSVANALFSLVQQRMMYRKYGASSFSSPGG